MDILEILNSRFAIPGQLRFQPLGEGLVAVHITNTHASATLCLQGGHLLSWQPASCPEPVIWMSPAAKFAPHQAIRGGIPVCWPWFGAHASQASFPAHGFARTQPWQVTGTRALEDGSTEIALTLLQTGATHVLWPHPSRLDMLLNVGNTLKIALITRNLGEEDFVIREALHTYFQVGDIAKVSVSGLAEGAYMDKAAGGTRSQQVGAVSFSGEVDRVYVNTGSTCVIEDPGLQRRIRIAKLGSQSTVVWNPWQARAAQMGDLGPHGWRDFVCVESGNALENAVTVTAGGSHTLAVEYSVAAM
ncbi:MAG: D-hexose-6-phosphate mutarotase [Burkholderiaceae bacterium]|nr:D-hexose-6-phosphate mutarotase [Burkholderiaceae bacterium]